MQDKPNWVNRPYALKICQIEFPITADCLEGVLATKMWHITKEAPQVNKIIYAKYKTPHNRNPDVFKKLHAKDLHDAYLELMDRLGEEKEDTRKLGWRVVGKGVELPTKREVLKELGREDNEYYKYKTKYSAQT